MNPKENSEVDQGDRLFRHGIAWTLLVTSILGLIILGGVVILAADSNDDKLDAAHFVFVSLLPLFGTWIGTLLAFYFSKENLDTATRSVGELSRALSGVEKLKAIFAKEKAIPLSAIYLPKDEAGNPERNLKKIIEALRREQKQRLLIFKDSNKIERVLHLSVLDGFVSSQILNPGLNAKKPEDLTLDDMLTDADIEKSSRLAFAAIPQNSTLADAKAAMDRQSERIGPSGSCADVFLTESGAPDLPVLGWITNAIIAQNARF